MTDLFAGRRQRCAVIFGLLFALVAAVAALSPLGAKPAAAAASFPSGYQQLKVDNDGLCVDVAGASASSNAAIDQWGCKSSDQSNQEFQFNPVSGGYGELQNQNSGLDINVDGASTASMAPVIQYTQDGSANSLWLPIQLSDGSWQFQNQNSGLCLDVTGQSSTAGTQLEQYACKSSAAGTNQGFSVSSASGAAAPPTGGNLSSLGANVYVFSPGEYGSRSHGRHREEDQDGGGRLAHWAGLPISNPSACSAGPDLLIKTAPSQLRLPPMCAPISRTAPLSESVSARNPRMFTVPTVCNPSAYREGK